MTRGIPPKNRSGFTQVLDWLERNRSNLAAILVVLVTVAGVTLLQLPRRPALQVLSPSVSAAPPPIRVHVVGAVRSPGVYQLEADARVDDAVKAAGGPMEAADLVALNLATPLRDGQQVVVPQANPAPIATHASPPPSLPVSPSPVGAPRPDKLDLNSATKQQLEALPGVGPVTAQKILDYRDKNGRFTSIEELRDAKLVNASIYERIKGMVIAR